MALGAVFYPGVGNPNYISVAHRIPFLTYEAAKFFATPVDSITGVLLPCAQTVSNYSAPRLGPVGFNFIEYGGDRNTNLLRGKYARRVALSIFGDQMWSSRAYLKIYRVDHG